MKRFALAALFAVTMLPAVSNAQVYVRVEPPAPIVERHGPPPGHEFVWIDGYHRWDGHRYVWVAGRWERPPHPHAVWVADHWVHHHEGWVLVEGRWR